MVKTNEHMEENDFIKIIRDPSSISTTQVTTLKEIIQKYPYFQIAHTLIAKEAWDTNSPYKDYAVQIASIHAPNRSYLKTLLEGKLSFMQDPPTPPPTDTLPVQNQKKEEVKKTEYDFINGYIENIAQRSKKDESNPKSVYQFQTIQEALDNHLYIDPTPEKEISLQELQIDLSEISSTFHNNLATETLAKIMIQQKKKDRAIEIYKKLILKFPQKKSYFLDLISHLNNNL